MEPPRSEIILLNVFDNSKNRNVPFWRSSQLVAPLGLFCLEELSPDRVLAKSVGLEFSPEDFVDIEASQVRFVILQESDFFDQALVEKYFKALRLIFPYASIGIAGQRAESFANHFNFSIFGIGTTVILNMLRGIPIKGFSNTLEKDLRSQLPIPEKDCFYSHEFRSAVERTISGKTLDIYKPWMGFLDRSSIEFEIFNEEWVKNLLIWLNKMGYRSFQFNDLGNDPEHIHLLRTLCWSLKVDFGIFIPNWEFIERIKTWPGHPLKQVWFSADLKGFYSKSMFDQVNETMEAVKSSGVSTGIFLKPDFLLDNTSAKVLRLVKSISFIDSSKWNGICMRNVAIHFWKSNWRFCKRLFSVKTAMELVDFMRLSYSILECIFFPTGGDK
jgi:hypothetical protein